MMTAQLLIIAYGSSCTADDCTTAFADAPRPIPPPPAPDYSGLIAGVAVASVVAFIAILAPICLAAYSIPTYSFRAYKRELEDGVYALIVSARADDQVSKAKQSVTCDEEVRTLQYSSW